MEFRDGDLARLTIPAGKSIVFGNRGEIVRCYEADGELEVTFNNGSGRSLFAAGTARRAQNGGIFEQFEVHNPNDFDVIAVIGWAYGDLIDNRAQVYGNVPVRNVEGETLAVEDIAVQDKLDEVIAATNTKLDAVITMLQSDKNQRQGLTTLANTSYASAVNTTTVIASAAANTHGVIIRLCTWSGNADFHASLFINGNRIGPRAAYYQGMMGGILRDIFVPAGLEVSLVSNSTYNDVYCFYEVLNG